jgi:hypothetical protein
MTALRRIWWAAGLLGVAFALQAGLLVHMIFGPTHTYPPLRKPFGELPAMMQVDQVGKPPLVWTFETRAAESSIRSRLPFEPVDLIYRRGRAGELNLEADCYVVHGANGEDRKHHPEICVRDVQQIPELPEGRGIVLLGKDPKRPVQRFCFQNGPGEATTLYYWHYTFAPEKQMQQSWLPRPESFRVPPPSASASSELPPIGPLPTLAGSGSPPLSLPPIPSEPLVP